MRRIVTALLVVFCTSLALTPPPAASEEADVWMEDLEAARALARNTGRPLLVYVRDGV